MANMNIKLYWKSLKNEIDAETWKSGKCYITEEKAEERAEAQTGNDTLDVNYCYRKIEQGIMSLQDIAHKYFVDFTRGIQSGSGGSSVSLLSDDEETETASTTTSAADTTETADNKLNNKVSYWTIGLNFGDRQNVNSNLLANELHKYIVLNVLQEWSKIANPTLTKEYLERLNNEEVRIKSIMYRKEEPNWDE